MDDLYTKDVKIIRYQEGDMSLEKEFSGIDFSDNDGIHTFRDYDSLESIAYEYYGQERLWYIIAMANDIIDPWDISSGDILIIPFNYDLNTSN